jgi:hypothetical protein
MRVGVWPILIPAWAACMRRWPRNHRPNSAARIAPKHARGAERPWKSGTVGINTASPACSTPPNENRPLVPSPAAKRRWPNFGPAANARPFSDCSVIFRPLRAFPTHHRKIFSSRDRFAFSFSPEWLSGDDCRPRSRGRGGAVQLSTSTSKRRKTSMKIKTNVKAGIIVVC